MNKGSRNYVMYYGSFSLVGNKGKMCGDTACVEVKLTDGSMVSIDCDAVENEYANNMYETSELVYLIYNEPISCIRLLPAVRWKNICETVQITLSDLR